MFAINFGEKMKEPKKWTEIYPYGTQEGSEEAIFFKVISRTKWDYRSLSSIVSETKLSQQRVEEIVEKYANYKPPMLYQHLTRDDHWGYWERCKDRLPTDTRDISEKDKDQRIENHICRKDSGS